MILLQVVLPSRRLVRTWIVKQLFQVFSSVCRKEREIDITTLCNRQETGKNFTKSLSGKLNWPSEERKWLIKNLFKAEAEMEARYGERGIRILLFMKSIRSSKPQRFQQQQANRWADQVQTEKSACMENWN